MNALFKTRTAKEWEDLVNAAGTPCSIIYESSEWMRHEHARTSKQVIEVDDPEYGTMLQPGVTPRLYGSPGAVRRGASRPDADRAEVLGPWLEAAPPALPQPDARFLRSALEGVKVLDLTIILAGPTCGRTLAEFGAEVVKIDDPNRDGGVRLHNDVNRGKQSLLLDLKTAEGRELFWKLAEDADVIVESMRAGKFDRLGLGYEEARRRNPSVIYASINAYGHEAPWEERPGWQPLAEATAGMQHRFAGERPYRQAFPINDYGAGLMAAYAVALALYHRQRTGEGQHVKAALAYTACMLQSPFFQGYEGKVRDEPRGQEALGWAPLQRLYRASDGWLFLGATADLLPSLGAVDGLSGIEDLQDDALIAFLEERIATRPAEEWTALLTAAGARRGATARAGRAHARSLGRAARPQPHPSAPGSRPRHHQRARGAALAYPGRPGRPRLEARRRRPRRAQSARTRRGLRAPARLRRARHRRRRRQLAASVRVGVRVGVKCTNAPGHALRRGYLRLPPLPDDRHRRVPLSGHAGSLHPARILAQDLDRFWGAGQARQLSGCEPGAALWSGGSASAPAALPEALRGRGPHQDHPALVRRRPRAVRHEGPLDLVRSVGHAPGLIAGRPR